MWSHALFKLYTWAIHPAPRWEQLIKVAGVLWKKGPEPNSYYLSMRMVWISLQKRKKKTLCNSTQTQFIHTACGPRSLCTWSTCITYAHWVPWQLFPRQQLKSWMMMMTQQEELTNSSRMKNELNLSTFDLPILRLYKHVNPMTLLCACLNVVSEIWSNKLQWKHRTAVNVVTLQAQHTNNRQFKNVKCIFQSREAWIDPELVNMWNHPIAACFYCSFRAGLIQRLGGAEL